MSDRDKKIGYECGSKHNVGKFEPYFGRQTCKRYFGKRLIANRKHHNRAEKEHPLHKSERVIARNELFEKRKVKGVSYAACQTKQIADP